MKIQKSNQQHQQLVNKIEIKLIGECIEHVDALAPNLYEEWQLMYNDLGVHCIDDLKAEMTDIAKNIDQLPLTYVLTVDGKLAGTGGLDNHDFPKNYPYGFIAPWIVCVYVLPEFRGQGLLYIIMNTLIEKASQMKLSSVWLYTDNMQNSYKKLGFRSIETLKYHDKRVTVMRLDFQDFQSQFHKEVTIANHYDNKMQNQ